MESIVVCVETVHVALGVMEVASKLSVSMVVGVLEVDCNGGSGEVEGMHGAWGGAG